MKLKEQIISMLDNNDKNLSEIVSSIPDRTPSSVRGTINLLVKKGIILRPSKGKYRLGGTNNG